MKNLIKYVISPIIFLGVYLLVEYLIHSEIDLKMAFSSTLIYAILNSIYHMVFDKRLY